MSGNERVWIACEVMGTTEKAICVREEPFAIWIPISLIGDFEFDGHKELADLDRGDEVRLEVPRWLVEKRGLDTFVVDQ